MCFIEQQQQLMIMNWLKLKRKFLLSYVLPSSYSKCRVWALRHSGFDIGQGVYLGKGLTITVGYADKTMNLTIGDRVSFGPNVTLVVASQPNNSRLKPILSYPKRSIVIHEDAWIGAGAIIMPNVEIGTCSVVGSGSVVTRDVPPYTIVAGNPAKIIKTINKELVDKIAE